MFIWQVELTHLDLRGVEVHGDDVVSAGHRQHVGDQLGRYGRSTLKRDGGRKEGKRRISAGLLKHKTCFSPLILSFGSRHFGSAARLTLSFLSCRAYGKQGMTAVTRDDEAILQALIMISSSIRLSLISPQPLWMMYTSSPRTLSPISTLLGNKKKTNVKNRHISGLAVFRAVRVVGGAQPVILPEFSFALPRQNFPHLRFRKASAAYFAVYPETKWSTSDSANRRKILLTAFHAKTPPWWCSTKPKRGHPSQQHTLLYYIILISLWDQ